MKIISYNFADYERYLIIYGNILSLRCRVIKYYGDKLLMSSWDEL